MSGILSKILNWKEGLELTNPGSFEHLHREARNVSLTQQFFEGGKADLAKGMSANFQVSHAFTLGTMTLPATYHFGAIYVAGKHLLHGIIDTNGIFQGKYHFNFTKNLAARLQSQISNQPGQSMIQSELEYLGPDYSLNVKAINPDPSAQTGIFTASLIQSLTKSFAVGAEFVGQRMDKRDDIETGYNLGAKYFTPETIFTVNVQQLAALQASYFQRVSPAVELGSELQMYMAGPRSDAVCTVSAKFDYKQACVRTQLDSTGKVGLLYEEKIYPGFSLLMAGEIDHVKATSRFGLGINMES